MECFNLVSKYVPSGDQPEAIRQLVKGINDNKKPKTVLPTNIEKHIIIEFFKVKLFIFTVNFKGLTMGLILPAKPSRDCQTPRIPIQTPLPIHPCL